MDSLLIRLYITSCLQLSSNTLGAWTLLLIYISADLSLSACESKQSQVASSGSLYKQRSRYILFATPTPAFVVLCGLPFFCFGLPHSPRYTKSSFCNIIRPPIFLPASLLSSRYAQTRRGNPGLSRAAGFPPEPTSGTTPLNPLPRREKEDFLRPLASGPSPA